MTQPSVLARILQFAASMPPGKARRRPRRPRLPCPHGGQRRELCEPSLEAPRCSGTRGPSGRLHPHRLEPGRARDLEQTAVSAVDDLARPDQGLARVRRPACSGRRRSALATSRAASFVLRTVSGVAASGLAADAVRRKRAPAMAPAVALPERLTSSRPRAARERGTPPIGPATGPAPAGRLATARSGPPRGQSCRAPRFPARCEHLF